MSGGRGGGGIFSKKNFFRWRPLFFGPKRGSVPLVRHLTCPTSHLSEICRKTGTSDKWDTQLSDNSLVRHLTSPNLTQLSDKIWNRFHLSDIPFSEFCRTSEPFMTRKHDGSHVRHPTCPTYVGLMEQNLFLDKLCHLSDIPVVRQLSDKRDKI